MALRISELFLFVLLVAQLNVAIATPHPNADPGLFDLVPILNNLPILNYPPAHMITTNPDPECQAINGGARWCCQSTFDGDMPIVMELAPVLGYKLNPNSVNGIFCKKDPVCTVGTDLCCQVDAFPKVLSSLLNLAMYCQHTPRKWS
ncbi:hypothetical protein BGZ60DRAFT_408068 [Tricladium varicosporioides]|nr:hypothetical protein BGZ60DRAFT_408068 [Hymenoscyphus varicosporioides]